MLLCFTFVTSPLWSAVVSLSMRIIYKFLNVCPAFIVSGKEMYP